MVNLTWAFANFSGLLLGSSAQDLIRLLGPGWNCLFRRARRGPNGLVSPNGYSPYTYNRYGLKQKTAIKGEVGNIRLGMGSAEHRAGLYDVDMKKYPCSWNLVICGYPGLYYG